jgi:hypothetical protein
MLSSPSLRPIPKGEFQELNFESVLTVVELSVSNNASFLPSTYYSGLHLHAMSACGTLSNLHLVNQAGHASQFGGASSLIYYKRQGQKISRPTFAKYSIVTKNVCGRSRPAAAGCPCA